MFDEMIRRNAAVGATAAESPALVAGISTSWSELAGHADALAAALAEFAGRRIGVCMQASATAFATLAALDRLGADVFLLNDRAPADQVSSDSTDTLADDLALDAIISFPGELSIERRNPVGFSSIVPRGAAGSITILTSGTTGKPKAARHTWAGLARPIRRVEPSEAQRWLLSYRPQLYAGLQVILQCWVNRGTLIVDDSHGDVAALAKLMVERRAEYVSATPSYWRRLFMFADPAMLAHVPLKQATLGGEVVDQPILDALSTTFPAARIVHIYATTELGRCFSVTDRQAGFPARFLDRPSADGVQMKIDDGELLVQSANRMQSYDARSAVGVEIDGAWVRTGDFVEVRGDRVYFIGRRSEIINAGGNKVSPITVERVIRQTPGVADVRVFAKASSIAGQLVACELVVSPDFDAKSVQQEVARRCREQLAAHERPRLITIVDRIELTAAGKTRRAE